MRHLLVIGISTAIAGCDLPKPQKKSSATSPTASTTTSTASATATSTPNANPGPATSTSGNQTPRSAAKRVVTMNDLTQIRIFIENASAASGKMPIVNETYAAIKKEAPKIAELIDEKLISLHPATNREQIWAYETGAVNLGGYVVTSSGVEKMDAATLKQRLSQ